MLLARRYVADLRRMGPRVARYFVAIALVGFAIDGGIYAVLLNLFLDRMGYGPETIGLVNASGALIFAFASLAAGLIGERWGSRRAMLCGLGLLSLCTTLLAMADLLPATARLPWLIGTIIGLNFGLALYFVNTAPLLLGFVAADQRNQAYAAQTALISLASFVGSLVGGALPPLVGAMIGAALDRPEPYRYGLLAAGLAVAPALLAIAATRAAPAPAPPAHPLAPAPPVARAAPILGLLALIGLVRTLQVAGLAATTTFFNLYLDSELRVPTAQIGLLLAVGRLAGVPAALVTSALSARFGNRSVVIAASLATGVGMLPMALIPHWAAAGFGLVAVLSLSSIRYAASMVYFLDLVPPSRRATVAGVTEMAAGLCFTALTFGGGYIIALAGYRALFLLGAALSGLSALLFWAIFRRRHALAH